MFTYAVSLSLSRDLTPLSWESSVTSSVATLVQLAVWRFLGIMCDGDVGAPVWSIAGPMVHSLLLSSKEKV